jgi:hypothetical protein
MQVRLFEGLLGLDGFSQQASEESEDRRCGLVVERGVGGQVAAPGRQQQIIGGIFIQVLARFQRGSTVAYGFRLVPLSCHERSRAVLNGRRRGLGQRGSMRC